MSWDILSPFLLAAETTNEPESGFPAPEILFVFGAIFLSLYMLIVTWRRVARSKNRDLRTVSERVAEAMPRHEGPSVQMGELMAELAELSRQINGQLDTRMAKLEILQSRADATIERLEKSLKKARLEPDYPGSHSESVKSDRPVKVELSELRQRFSHPPAEEPVDPDTAKVLKLASEGKNAVEIAQEMGRPTGEIELILALRKKSPDKMS